ARRSSRRHAPGRRSGGAGRGGWAPGTGSTCSPAWSRTRSTATAITRSAGRAPGSGFSSTTARRRGAPGAGRSPWRRSSGRALPLLAEVDPREVTGREDVPDEVMVLSGELARVEAKVAELEAELLNGDVAALARVLRKLEGQKRDLAGKLSEARQKASHPLSE